MRRLPLSARPTVRPAVRSPSLRLPRRSPAVWALAAVLSALCWWALLAGSAHLGGPQLMLGALAGGWGISLLPVHCNRRRTGPRRRRRGGRPLIPGFPGRTGGERIPAGAVQRRGGPPRRLRGGGDGPRWQDGHQ